jgi:hypothetical protein
MPRLELAGDLQQLLPIVITFSEDGGELDLTDYPGYTTFEVICIGGGGGRGGGIDTNDTGTHIRSFGGEGGGGGIHRVMGLVESLSNPISINVGLGGTPGLDHASNPALTTDGQNGGFSQFGTICKASGGKGGKRVQANSETITTDADGGQGGKGNSTVSGGGAAGGIAGTPENPGPGTLGTNGEAGTWDGTIGSGGGGGAGGVGKYGSPGSTLNPATAGGDGSYNIADLSVYVPGESQGLDTDTGQEDIVPGIGGGAKATPLTNLADVYGSSGVNGIVVVRLTQE